MESKQELPQQVDPTIEQSKAALSRAQKLLADGHVAESREAFQNVVALKHDAAEGFYGLGVTSFRNKSFGVAVIELQNAISLNPNHANAYYYLGEISEIDGSPTYAIALYQKALQIKPGHVGATKKLEGLARGPQESPRSSEQPRQASTPAPTPSPREQVAAQRHLEENMRSVPSRSNSRHTSGAFYELIQNDPSQLAKETKELLDRVEFEAVPPRFTFWMDKLILTLAACFLFFAGCRANERSLPTQLRLLVTAKGFENEVLVAALVCCVIVIINNVTTEYTLNEGRLKITSGVFARPSNNVELYRVEDVELHQNFWNRLTGDGSLVFTVVGGRGGKDKKVEVKGIAPYHDLEPIFDDLRNLVILLRTGAWGKGVIN